MVNIGHKDDKIMTIPHSDKEKYFRLQYIESILELVWNNANLADIAT